MTSHPILGRSLAPLLVGALLLASLPAGEAAAPPARGIIEDPASAALPDLVIGGTTIGYPPVGGGPTQVTAQMSNWGNATAFNVTLDLYVDNVSVGHGAFTLAPNASANVSGTVMLAPGTHTLRAVADEANTVAEQWETNNEYTGSFQVASSLPDLIANVTLSPAQPVEGASVTVVYETRNVGSAPASNFTFEARVDGVLVGLYAVPSLSPGGVFARSVNWTATAGNHTFQAFTDANNTVNESIEYNNFGYAHANITATLANLAARNVTLAWPSIDGQYVWISGLISNAGNTTATQVGYALFVDHVTIGLGTIPSLAPGQNRTVGAWWLATEGEHDAELSVDPSNTIPETNEYDNRAFRPFHTMGFRDVAVDILSVDHAPLRTDAGDAPNPAGRHHVRILVTNHANASATVDVNLQVSSELRGTTTTPPRTIGNATTTLAAHESRIITISWDPIAAGDVTLTATALPRGAIDPDMRDNRDRYQDFVIVGGLGGVILI